MAFGGNNGLYMEIASAMESAKDKRVDLVVWTQPHEASAAAIEKALGYIPRNMRLERLNFLFVGDTPDSERIRTEIEATGAKFFFHKR